MYYTIYRTTNLITGEYYIGQHKTQDVNDEYYGSGIALRESIEKYGIESFRKDILFVFDNESDMNAKEIELVNQELLSDPLSLNRQQGGTGGWYTNGTVVVKDEDKWIRIPCESYDPRLHVTPTSKTIKVFDKEDQTYKRINVSVYHNDKNRYLTTSSGKVSVREKATGITKSISLEEFDDLVYEKVFGGIVADVGGSRQYVTRKEFDQTGLNGCHKGKVTVLEKSTGIRKHIPVEEYYMNRDLYKSQTEGRVTVYDRQDQRTKSIGKEEFENNRDRYSAITTGQKTVWDIAEHKFKNIPKEAFDRRYHRLAGDKMIRCIDINGNLIIDFWGNKADFIEKYGNKIYYEAIAETKNYLPKDRKRYGKYTGCSFTLIDWRNNYERSEE